MNDRAPIANAETALLQGRLSRLFGWVHAAIIWERAWRRVWPCVAVLTVFLSIALLDVLPALPYWGHWLVLVGFGGFNSVFEGDACDDFGQVIKAA